MFEWMFYSVRLLVREKSDLFFTLIFPIMMVAILGNMLAELDNPDERLGIIRIAYYVEDEGPADWESWINEPGNSHNAQIDRISEVTAVQAFIDGLAEGENLEMIKAASAEAAFAEVDSYRADAAMIFEAPLGISIFEGGDIYKNRAVMLIARSFSRSYAAFKASVVYRPEIFQEIEASGLADFSGLTADKDLGVNRSMMDFYAVTMVIMIAFMGGGIGGASTMFYDRQNGILRRVTASTRSRARIFLESVIGVLPRNIMQTIIIMIPSVLFLGAHYAKTWQGNLLLFAFFILLGVAVTGVSMLIGLFIRVNPYMPIMALLWALLFISGTFSKDIYIEGFSEYLPMSIAQRAAFDFTMFGRYDQLLSVMTVCAVVLLASCILGAILFRKKEIML